MVVLLVVNWILMFSSVVCQDSLLSNLTAEMFPPDYSKNTAPKEKNLPMNVRCKVQLLSLGVDEITQSIKVTMSVYVEWEDKRLRYPIESYNRTISLEGEFRNRLWVPNLYFVNEVGSKESFINPPKVKMIFNTSLLYYHIRYSSKILCDFQYYYYPMDTQNCIIQLQSFDHANNDVNVRWVPPNSQLPSNRVPPQFMVDPEAISGNEKCDDTLDEETMSCLRIEVTMVRLLGFHCMQMFIPSVLIVIVSWMGFWINVEIVPARISLGVTALLTLVTQFARAQDGLPPISYVKAIDVWMLGCLLMVFASMLEFSVAYCLHTWKKGQKISQAKTLVVNTVMSSNTVESKPHEQPRPKPRSVNADDPANEAPMLSFDKYQRVDKISRFLFPSAYILFIIVFYFTYTGPLKANLSKTTK